MNGTLLVEIAIKFIQLKFLNQNTKRKINKREACFFFTKKSMCYIDIPTLLQISIHAKK